MVIALHAAAARARLRRSLSGADAHRSGRAEQRLLRARVRLALLPARLVRVKVRVKVRAMVKVA